MTSFEPCQSPPPKFWRSPSSPVQRSRTVQVLRLCSKVWFVLSKSLQDLKMLESQCFDRTLRTTDKTSTSSRKAYLLQFCKFGFFNTDCQQGVFHEHAFQQWPVRVTRHSVTQDPHPGNLAVDDQYPGGRLIFYDFGQAQQLVSSTV